MMSNEDKLDLSVTSHQSCCDSACSEDTNTMSNRKQTAAKEQKQFTQPMMGSAMGSNPR